MKTKWLKFTQTITQLYEVVDYSLNLQSTLAFTFPGLSDCLIILNRISIHFQ